MGDLPTRSFDTDISILQQIKEVGAQRRSGNWHNSMPMVDVPIPQTVTIDCPLVRPYERFASNCAQCSYFQGVVQSTWSNDGPIEWAEKYSIRCGWALERRTRQLVIE